MIGYEVSPRAAKRTTEDCIVIKLSDLKRQGILKDGYMNRRNIACYEGGRNYAGTLTVVSDIDCLEIRPCLKITGVVGGRIIDQRILLEGFAMRFGGDRWYAKCPLTDKRCTTLALPRGETQFASMAGWNVVYASQRFSPVRRMCHALDKAEERWERLSKYTRKPTRRRHEEKIMHLSLTLGVDPIFD